MKISKSAQKKLDAKAAKEAKKAARAAELAAEMSAVTIDDFAKESYGVMKMVQSTERPGKQQKRWRRWCFYECFTNKKINGEVTKKC